MLFLEDNKGFLHQRDEITTVPSEDVNTRGPL